MRQYYIHHDFYHYKNDETLTIISNFPTYQQTTPSTCGPCCALMVLKYFGIDMDEMEISKEVSCKIPGGTEIRNLEDFFINHGFEILSERDLQRKEDQTFFTLEEFKSFVIDNLKENRPIIIENVESGGHYRVIIGYDEISKVTGDIKNDMLIFADSGDTYDMLNDGYNYAPVYRTFKMWFDDHHLPKDQKQQPFILIKGKKE